MDDVVQVATVCTSELLTSVFLFQVKTQIQSQAPVAVAKGANVVLGVQHEHRGMVSAFSTILHNRGPLGVFDGASGAVLRVAIGSCAQLSTFSYCMEYIENNQVGFFGLP